MYGSIKEIYYSDGSITYSTEKGYHNVDDKPAVIHSNGDKEWWQDGKRHRIGGPAVLLNSGFKSWWVDGNRHRVDGPAIIDKHGIEEWYYNGNHFPSKECWFEALAKDEQVSYLFNMEK